MSDKVTGHFFSSSLLATIDGLEITEGKEVDMEVARDETQQSQLYILGLVDRVGIKELSQNLH